MMCTLVTRNRRSWNRQEEGASIPDHSPYIYKTFFALFEWSAYSRMLPMYMCDSGIELD